MTFVLHRQFEQSAPIMGIIVDHFLDQPYGNQQPTMGHPCNYRSLPCTTTVTNMYNYGY